MGSNHAPFIMRCRFCDTEIAAKALICYRCGRATSDPRVAPPPVTRGPRGVVTAGLVLAAAGVAAYVPEVVDGTALWAAWAALAAGGVAAAGAWWRGRR